VKGFASKIASGGAGLTKDDRQAIYEMAGKFKEASERKYKQRLHEYKGYFSNYGVDPNKYLNPSAGEKTVVETRVTKDGKKLIKYSDGTIEEQ
jgi:ABC-type transporter MlaC component